MSKSAAQLLYGPLLVNSLFVLVEVKMVKFRNSYFKTGKTLPKSLFLFKPRRARIRFHGIFPAEWRSEGSLGRGGGEPGSRVAGVAGPGPPLPLTS